MELFFYNKIDSIISTVVLPTTEIIEPLETGVFCYGQKAYSVETKLACIEMKKAGKSNKVIMDTLSIKNASQAKTW